MATFVFCRRWCLVPMLRQRSTAAHTPTLPMAIPLGGAGSDAAASGKNEEHQPLVDDGFIDDDNTTTASSSTGNLEDTSLPPNGGKITSLQASASVAKAIMGAGSFSLPWAFAQTGYVAGPILMVALMALSVSSLRTLVACRRLARRSGNAGGTSKRPSASYVDVARAAFGDAGARIVYCASVSASVGVCGSYLVFVAASLLSLLPPQYENVGQTQLVLMVLPIAVILSSVRDPNKFAFTALLGDVSVLLGMGVVVVYGILYRDEDRSLGDGCVAFGTIDGCALAFGAVGFLFFIHFLVLPIEGSMARPGDFDQMVSLTFLGCAAVSAVFGVLGYLFFGGDTEQIVILNIRGSFFVSCVKLLLCIDLLFTYPVVMRPSIEIVEQSLVLQLNLSDKNNGGAKARLGVCFVLGVTAAGAGIFIPAFALLSGLVGGVCQTFLAFVMPPVMLRVLKQCTTNKGAKETRSALDDAKVVGTVLFGVVMILWTVHTTWLETRRGE
mmetsp:Transcript_8774/g.17913  ORF Transcript_8774/g.17913 Transcript_8774/m.17913 type:complete len:498 (-) Transcript_8774:1409-2902(-)